MYQWKTPDLKEPSALVYSTATTAGLGGVEIEVISTMCNLSFLVEGLISGNRNLASVQTLRARAEAKAENRTRAHQLELQLLIRQI